MQMALHVRVGICMLGQVIEMKGINMNAEPSVRQRNMQQISGGLPFHPVGDAL